MSVEEKSVCLRSVGHRFEGSETLFSNVTMDLRPGKTYALVGPSGSGKSTLLNLMAGWLKPTSGAVSHTNVSRVGWVFQNPHGVARRSALDHVVLPYLIRGMLRPEAEEHARARLADFGLAQVSALPFGSLSGGEAQRLMLARGIAAAPDLFLVDEPTAQLDVRTGDAVNESLSSLRSGSTIVVIATHDSRTRASCTDVIDLGRYQ